MARFVFQFESILAHRQRLRDQRQRELFTEEAALSILEVQLRAMDQSVQATLADLRQNRLVGKLDLAFLAAHRRYSNAVTRQAVELTQKIAAQQTRVTAARKNLVAASTDFKAMEKLKEKQHERWLQDQSLRDTAANDEIGLQWAMRNLAEDNEYELPTAGEEVA
jgi:flagellar export protein FliJ